MYTASKVCKRNCISARPAARACSSPRAESSMLAHYNGDAADTFER